METDQSGGFPGPRRAVDDEEGAAGGGEAQTDGPSLPLVEAAVVPAGLLRRLRWPLRPLSLAEQQPNQVAA